MNKLRTIAIVGWIIVLFLTISLGFKMFDTPNLIKARSVVSVEDAWLIAEAYKVVQSRYPEMERPKWIIEIPADETLTVYVYAPDHMSSVLMIKFNDDREIESVSAQS